LVTDQTTRTSSMISEKIYKSGEMFSEIGNLFKEAETVTDINERIIKANTIFLSVATLEEGIFKEIADMIY